MEIMTSLLGNPLFQSAAAPFAIAVAAGAALRTRAGLAGGGAFALAVFAAVWMMMGLQLTPLNSTRKMLIVGLGAFAAGMALELAGERRKRGWIAWALAAAAAGSALWLIWPRLGRLPAIEAGGTAALAALYAGLLVPLVDGLNRQPLAQSVAAVGLGAGMALTALIGASALLGQLAGALAAAAGGLVLLQVIRGEFRLGSGFALPMALLAALVAISAVVYARLPWYVPGPLLAIPLLARLPVPRTSTITRAILLLLYTLPAAGLSIALALRAAAASAY